MWYFTLLFRSRIKFFPSYNLKNINSFSTTKKMTEKLVWVDCEMTGLDVSKDKLLEVAVIITDSNLQPIDQLNPIQIKATQNELDSMNDWCKKHFALNGLTESCLRSNITMEEADKMLDNFMNKNNVKQGILAGNSISTDREFLNKYCPKFVSNLHYRMVDVSSVKVLVDLWYKDRTLWNKPTQHRALNDIYDSINELKYYRDKYFLKPLGK